MSRSWRQIDRQTDRQIQRQTVRQREGERDGTREKRRERQTDRQTDRHRQTDRGEGAILVSFSARRRSETRLAREIQNLVRYATKEDTLLSAVLMFLE